jgi:hypothetical protein
VFENEKRARQRLGDDQGLPYLQFPGRIQVKYIEYEDCIDPVVL